MEPTSLEEETVESPNLTQDEYNYQTKMATEKGLLGIGAEMILKKQEEEKKVKFKENIEKYLESDKPDKKSKLIISFKRYVKIVNEEITNLDKQRLQYDEDYKELNIESEQYLAEVEELETEVEKLRSDNEKLTNTNWWYFVFLKVLFNYCAITSFVVYVTCIFER